MSFLLELPLKTVPKFGYFKHLFKNVGYTLAEEVKKRLDICIRKIEKRKIRAEISLFQFIPLCFNANKLMKLLRANVLITCF